MMGAGGVVQQGRPMFLEFFNGILHLPTPFNMVVLIVLICSVAGVLTGIATQIRKFVCYRQDIDFKRELLDRGLSADEIERILNARSNEPVTTKDEG